MNYITRRLGDALFVGILLGMASVALGQPAPRNIGGPKHITHVGSEVIIDDRRIQMRLAEEGARLIAAGRTTPRRMLISQLDRETCRLQLPKSQENVRSSRENLAAQARASVLIVARLHRGHDDGAWMAVPATGFFISESGTFVTSRHVVSGSDYETIVVMTGEGLVVPVSEVLAADPVRDIALLQAEITHVSPLPLQRTAAVGSAVYLMSHPMGRFYTFTEGVVCRRSLQHEGDVTRELLDISAEFGPGSSGAPLLDAYGNAVGWADQLRVRSTGGKNGNDSSPVLVFRECGVAADILRLIQR